jgi:hypothetical protein
MAGNEEVGALLNGYLALWHPAVACAAAGPPRLASPYDHEQPSRGLVYAVPDAPALYLPDDWDQRVEAIGALSFRCSLDRSLTFHNLQQALRACGETAPAPGLIDLPADKVAPFLGLAFGYLHVEALLEAFEHQASLAASDLWIDVQQAIAALGQTDDPEAWRRHLQSAADRLLRAREEASSATIHVVDLCLLDETYLTRPWPASFDRGVPVNLVACASLLERLSREKPDRLDALRRAVQAEQAEVCGGTYLEREDPLLPLESQLWNLLHGLTVSRDLLGAELRVFARKRTGFHPQLPLLLQTVGLTRALLLTFDGAVIPSHRTAVVSWPSGDGKQVEAFTRSPHAADDPQTYFHVAHHLHKSITEDQGATLVLLHGAAEAASWYEDWLELTRLAPVLGQWTTLTNYFNAVMAGEYASPASADEFHTDYLGERTGAHSPVPVSGFARHLRWRRRLDTAWTLATLHRSLAGRDDSSLIDSRLANLEKRIETIGPAAVSEDNPDADLALLEQEAAAGLAGRLLAKATSEEPGYVVLNPCSFARRVALELDAVAGPLPIAGPIKAGQFSEGHARLVVEVPQLGFAWFPRSGPPGTPQPPMRMRLADQRVLRNEFFEAEIDPTTGGLRGLRDHRTRSNRIGQQLVYNPGGSMRASRIDITSSGPALGEIITEGVLLDEHDQELATFRQRFRAWLGRPVLDLRIEITPQRLPEGYPWHAYYAARFAWADERATLRRGVCGMAYTTTYTRPETADYLEVRLGRQSTAIFPGGLPFHQRHAERMVDVILVPEGETARTFDLALGLDREYPMQTALGLATPVSLVAVSKGPPHVGAAGWLFHLDMPNLLLTGLRPAAEGADALVARLQECGIQHTQAEFRCVRNPQRAVLLDARGTLLTEASVSGDAALFDVAQGELAHLRVDFS